MSGGEAVERTHARAMWAALSVAALAIVSYTTSLSNGFALDDVHIIRDNSLVDALDLLGIWASPYWPSAGLGLYRPLTTTLFALQWQLGGGEPLLFHVVSVLLHAGVSMLVFLLLRALLPRNGGGLAGTFLGAAVFAAHPVHVEAVANVVGQAELLAAAAVLGACVLYASRPARSLGWRRLLVLGLLYALGLCAKEHAIVLPALLVAIDVAQRRVRWSREEAGLYARAIAALMLTLLLTATLFLAARAAVLGSVLGGDPNPAYGFLQGDLRIWNALRAWPELYRLLLFPLDLSVDYSPAVIPVATGLDPMTVAGGLLLLGTILAATRTRAGLGGFAAAWLLVSILPVSNLLFPIGVLVAERTLYLPSVSVAIAVAAAMTHLLSTDETSAPLLPAFAALVVLGLGARTAVRNPVWKSTDTVHASLVRDHPESYRAQWVQAAAAHRSGDRDRADLHYEMADRIYDADPLLQLEHANFHLQAGNTAVGLRHLQRARALDPGQVPARLASAYIFNRTGHPDSALSLLRVLRNEGRVTQGIEQEIARALEGVGDFERAAELWREAAARADGALSWEYHARAARAAARGGDLELALRALDEARSTAPVVPQAIRILDTLERLIASGCLAEGECAGDPLAQPEAQQAEANR